MTKHYFVNTQTGRRYEIVKVEGAVGPQPAVGEVTLRGEYGEFTAPFDKAAIRRMGYRLEKVEE